MLFLLCCYGFQFDDEMLKDKQKCVRLYQNEGFVIVVGFLNEYDEG